MSTKGGPVFMFILAGGGLDTGMVALMKQKLMH